MKIKATLIVAALGVILLCSCGNNANPVVGTWETQLDDALLSITFLEDGTYTADIDGLDLTGVYTISGQEITVADDACGEEVEGVYNFSVIRRQLTFTLVVDECDRSGFLPGTWERK